MLSREVWGFGGLGCWDLGVALVKGEVSLRGSGSGMGEGGEGRVKLRVKGEGWWFSGG